MSDRRTFLRGLAALPLIGGSVALIGSPTAAAVPLTPELLRSYKTWLYFEHRMAAYELAGHNISLAHELEKATWNGTPGDDWHFQWCGNGYYGPAGWRDAPQPSTRAAVVLSAVNCAIEDHRP